jgi:hypothetical protein
VGLIKLDRLEASRIEASVSWLRRLVTDRSIGSLSATFWPRTGGSLLTVTVGAIGDLTVAFWPGTGSSLLTVTVGAVGDLTITIWPRTSGCLLTCKGCLSEA